MKFNDLKEKFNALSKTNKILLIFIFVVCPLLGMIFEPKIETGYTRVAEKVCNSENKCVSYKMFEPILVSEGFADEFQVWNDKKENIGKISKKNVVFEGTPEYEQTKQEKAEYDKKVIEAAKVLEASLKKERAAKIAKLEPIVNKIFYKVELKKFSDDGSGIYDFYINPVKWVQMPFDQKQELFKNCCAYVQLKTNGTEKEFAKLGTKIKSSSNATVLAEYTVFGGIKIK